MVHEQPCPHLKMPVFQPPAEEGVEMPVFQPPADEGK